MPSHQQRDTHQKALSINLDETMFGSFAEIGAGQEVARWFLRVGGASGTVAKTISAYDKEVSDDLYGAGTRYVSKQRLEAMLHTEWEQLLTQLNASRGAHTRFFSFVDTVSARNYAGTNDCHGWVGLRFQREPGGNPHDVILHINLRDPTNLRQQEAVGILGVNLLYGVHYSLGSTEEFLASLFEELGLQRLEIDYLESSGDAFRDWDRRETHALLVAGGYAEAVVFPVDEQLQPANELLYKRALVLAPGRFDIIDQLYADLVRNTLAQLPNEELSESKGGLGLFCLAMPGASKEDHELTPKEIVTHVEMLQKLGFGVMVVRAQKIYELSMFANRYTKSRIHFAVGITMFMRVFAEQYPDLEGALLEGIARLFTQNVRVSVYPRAGEDVERQAKAAGLTGWSWKQTDGMVSAENLHPSGPTDHLYQFLLSSGFILPGRLGEG
jgi:hypothetical protein